jgi:iron complex outermembrane recepter protein
MLNRLRSKVAGTVRACGTAGALSAFAMLPMFQSGAMAQTSGQTAPQASTADPGGVLQQVVVTANRREQSINDVSTAMTAIGRDELRNANIDDIKDLQVLAPSITITEVFDIAQIFIRGVGANVQNPGASSGVAVYTDGAVIARQEAQLTSLFDLDRVEVLNGPQGTLYGRNAIGGAVNFITTKPSDKLEGYMRFGYGNYDANTLSAAVGGPLFDWLKARIAFNSVNHGGYGENIVTGNPINNEHRQMGRVSFVIDPTDNFTAFLSGEWYHQDDAAGILTLDGGASINPVTGKQTTTAGIINPATGQFAVVPVGLGGFALNKRDTAEPTDPFTRKDRWSVTGQLDWKINDWFHITNINNIQRITSWTSEDNAKSSIFLYTATEPLTRRIGDEPQVSSELQFKADNAWVNGIVGLTYFHENQTENQTLGSDSLFSNIRTSATADYLVAHGYDPVAVLQTCKQIGAMILGNPGLPKYPPRICGWGQQDVNAYGAYAHANIKLGALMDALQPLSLKLGGRYSNESINVYNPYFSFGYNSSFNANPVAANITAFSLIPASTAHNHGAFDDFSPEAGLEWRPFEDYLFYYTYSQGFKAGTGLTVPGNTNLAGPEKIKNNEVGFKGAFFEHRLQLGLAAYIYNLTGAQYQRSFPGPGVGYLTVLENAADTKNHGVELSMQSIPFDSSDLRVHFTGNVDYQHSRFAEYNTIDPADPRLFQTPALPSSALTESLKGNPTRDAPDWSMTGTFAIDFKSLRLPGNGLLTWSGDVNYQTRDYLTEFKKLVESAPPRTILDSQLSVRTNNGFTYSAYVKNLTNVSIITGITYINAAGSTRESTYFPPRTFGGTVAYDF